MRVGLVINPIAGMGGAVGLKGTDTPEVLEEAIRRGARPIAQDRTDEALRAAGDLFAYDFITAGGLMGEDVLRRHTTSVTVVCSPSGITTDKDTGSACEAILEAGVDLLLFTGGDGTARDVMDVVDERVPAIGIPSGVKMHSGVFANTPHDAGVLLRRTRVENLPAHRSEVMDIDEAEVRLGSVSASLYGYMLTPEEPTLMQPYKLALGGATEDQHKEAIAKYFVDTMKDGVLYILGPGTTLEAVGRRLEVGKTLLGVDLVADRRLLAKDVDEDTILKTLEVYPEARIVVSPIGAQGFIFGRGNQQISHRVIEKVGVRNVIILATPIKMKETKTLRVDTGDAELDEELRGYGKVIIGWGLQQVAPVN
ncbi:MAG: ATP-NAD kinase family protein [Methanomassiliicoccus sp.]|nr:ATP-NAD kinase family protein [Methanomassiliicoccus sp.]